MARNGKRLVGALARRQAVTNAERTVVAVKRLMGRRWSAKATQEAIQRMPYSVVAGPPHDVRGFLGGEQYTPPGNSAVGVAQARPHAGGGFRPPGGKAGGTPP